MSERTIPQSTGKRTKARLALYADSRARQWCARLGMTGRAGEEQGTSNGPTARTADLVDDTRFLERRAKEALPRPLSGPGRRRGSAEQSASECPRRTGDGCHSLVGVVARAMSLAAPQARARAGWKVCHKAAKPQTDAGEHRSMGGGCVRSAPCCQAHEVVAVTNHKRMFLFILVYTHTDAVLVAALPVTGNATSCRKNSDVSTLQSAHGHAAAGGVCGGQTGAGRNAVRHTATAHA